MSGIWVLGVTTLLNSKLDAHSLLITRYSSLVTVKSILKSEH